MVVEDTIERIKQFFNKKTDHDAAEKYQICKILKEEFWDEWNESDELDDAEDDEDLFDDFDDDVDDSDEELERAADEYEEKFDNDEKEDLFDEKIESGEDDVIIESEKTKIAEKRKLMDEPIMTVEQPQMTLDKVDEGAF